MLEEESCMQQTIKTVPRAPRAKVAQPARVRPYDSRCPEEICITHNVSRKGFYFETSLEHYIPGMYVYVTRNYHPGDLMSREEAGDIVRVEKLLTGKWGVAIRVLASSTRPAWLHRDDCSPQPDASSPQFRPVQPGGKTAMGRFFDSLRETELAIAERKQSVNAAASAMGRPDRRRTRRARVQVPLLVYGYTLNDGPFAEKTTTIEINAHGALIAMETVVPPGERLLLTNETNQKTQQCIVLSVTTRQRSQEEVAVAFATAAPQFWCK
jgi:hypothetical protein